MDTWARAILCVYREVPGYGCCAQCTAVLVLRAGRPLPAHVVCRVHILVQCRAPTAPTTTRLPPHALLPVVPAASPPVNLSLAATLVAGSCGHTNLLLAAPTCGHRVRLAWCTSDRCAPLRSRWPADHTASQPQLQRPGPPSSATSPGRLRTGPLPTAVPGPPEVHAGNRRDARRSG